MKKLLLSLALTLVTSFGATAVVSNQTATNAVVVATAGVLDSIQLYSTNVTPTIVRFYDGAITNVTAAYTNYLTYTTNIVTEYVTTLGTTNLLTNNVTYNVANVVAAATNNSTAFLTLVVPGSANGQVLNYTAPIPFVFRSNLTLSNDLTGVSGVVTYRTQ